MVRTEAQKNGGGRRLQFTSGGIRAGDGADEGVGLGESRQAGAQLPAACSLPAPPSPSGSLEHWTALSSGMEPETALWGPDLQDPGQSPDDAHPGEGHKKGRRS